MSPGLLEKILAAEKLCYTFKTTPRGEHIAWCLFHEDGGGKPPHAPNLHISEKGYHCHACGAKGNLYDLAVALDLHERIYDYWDRQGQKVYQIVRFNWDRNCSQSSCPGSSATEKTGDRNQNEGSSPLPRGKIFAARRPVRQEEQREGDTGWRWNLQGVERVLYNLPLLHMPELAEQPVYVVEGEKCADKAFSIGLIPVCNPFGAGKDKWRPEFSQELRGREVIILPDADAPGREHAQDIAASLAGVAKSVKMLDLYPDRADGSDVADWIESRESRIESPESGAALQDELAALLAKVTEWEKSGAPHHLHVEKDDVEHHISLLSNPRAKEPRHIDSLESEGEGDKEEWITFYDQAGYLTQGGALLLSAHKGLGKTTALLTALRPHLEKGKRVLWLSEEPAKNWRKKRESFSLQGLPLFLFFADNTNWEEWLKVLQTQEADIAVLDTFSGFTLCPDENDASAVMRCLWPLIILSRQKNWGLIVVHHLRKSAAEVGLGHSGSHALTREMDVTVEIHPDSDNAYRRILKARTRYEETPMELLVEYDPATHQCQALGSPGEVSTTETSQAVLDLLKEGGRLTLEELRAKLDNPPSDEYLRQILAREVAAGNLQRDRDHTRLPGRPFVYWDPDSAAPTTLYVHNKLLEQQKMAVGGGVA